MPPATMKVPDNPCKTKPVLTYPILDQASDEIED